MSESAIAEAAETGCAGPPENSIAADEAEVSATAERVADLFTASTITGSADTTPLPC
ncbi:hypothetical protein [Nonomuraea sp. B1E8]|uniref:hypothetical protein n=1 Tax=unclassified Nonomuraea TaxID=2593643 RepID=UPI00325C5B03